MRVVVLVPRRADGGRRDQLWAFVRDWYAQHHPDMDVVEGHHDDGPFNRSAAVNRAAENAGDWDLALITDADLIHPPAQLHRAIDVCQRTGKMTITYDTYRYLGEKMTNAVLAGFGGNWMTGCEFTMHGSCSGFFIGRDLWDETGGFDEGFDGWGYEDSCYNRIAWTFGGGVQTIPGDVFHLQHPTQDRTGLEDRLDRLNRYVAATGDRAAMRALLDELRVMA